MLLNELMTDGVRQALVIAEAKAKEMRHDRIGTEHLLLGLIAEGQGAAARILDDAGVDLAVAAGTVGGLAEKAAEPVAEHPKFSSRAKAALERSRERVLRQRLASLGTDQLLLALLDDTGCGAHRALESLDADIGGLAEQARLGVGDGPAERTGAAAAGYATSARLEAAIVRLDHISKKLDAVVERLDEIKRPGAET